MVSARQRQANGEILPVISLLGDELPASGLPKGSTIAVHGSRSLLLTLLAEATKAGAWAAVVGMPDLGMAAASELGVDLARVALIPQPGAQVLSVITALLEGMDLVVLDFSFLKRVLGAKASTMALRVSARARHRKVVLLCWGTWPGVQWELRCERGVWKGLREGNGRFTEREVVVHVHGRAGFNRPHRSRFILPNSEGNPAVLRSDSERTPTRDTVVAI
jgi:hypothetical protein